MVVPPNEFLPLKFHTPVRVTAHSPPLASEFEKT